MEAVVLALGASLTWGFADFFGPLKGRTFGALRVLVYVQLAGLLGIAVIVAIRGEGRPMRQRCWRYQPRSRGPWACTRTTAPWR